MDKISFIEDKNLFAYCNEIKNYDLISNEIEINKVNLDYYQETGDNLFGYKINKIKALTDLYGFNIYAVNFSFKNHLPRFNEKENSLIQKTVLNLFDQVEKKQGYYIIKIPSFSSMLINQFNVINKKLLFTGGTVCYSTTKLSEKNYDEGNGLLLKLATKEDKLRHYEELVNLSEASFKNYFGQYHISFVTRNKADLIYRDWIKKYLDIYDEDNLLIAKYKGKLVGFIAFDKGEFSYEVVLNCVDENFRGLKIYERMLYHCIQYCLKDRNLITVSTQLNNFYPQRTWINIGLKPFHTFYLSHFNNLK